ncbi:CPXCG motif-containing cysteine-rich protein [Desulfobulbus sp. AH-315-M07]|nr:CPXCG motif-containing cysteine-rich protein [Desulfobulbus sp. AH-315-M07]
MEDQPLCPYCNCRVHLALDEGGGDHQSYIEDCYVCCRPMQIEVWRDQGGELHATIRHQDA